ncbi:hypothetical protein [Streptomyces sp. NPDC046685]|uniref:hypothetical protein n=1 Tax=Streptomyces sp. NPDC046685 TaxID=3157202 RepID=UPI0033CD7DBD
MGRHRWGKAAAGALLTAVVVTTGSGCGGGAEAGPPAATVKAPELTSATTTFKDAVTKFDLTDGCPKAAGACWDKMIAVMEPARELRKAMNSHSAGPQFWSDAYALVDRMERGIAVGEDRVSNRPDVLGSAHELSRWLDAHPVQ